MKTGCGWLGQLTNPTDKKPIFVHGVTVPRWSEREQAYFPTRIEEYTLVADILQDIPRGTLVDSASGFNDEIHVLPRICANMGFSVVAIDENESSLVMAPHHNVTRYKGDIRSLPNLDASANAWLCISTLEHLSLRDRAMALQEGFRILKPGGIAILTADELEPSMFQWMMQPLGFIIDEVIPFSGTHLSPRVGWCVAQKPVIT